MDIKKSGEVDYKVFKKRDLNKLANYFVDLKKELEHEDTVLRLRVEFEDGSSIRGVDTSILDQTDTKLVKIIHFNLSNYSMEKVINIHVTSITGFYEVESKDNNWVDAKFAQLEEIFKATPNQNYWFSTFNRKLLLINIIGGVIGVLLYIFIFWKLIDNKSEVSFLVVLYSVLFGQVIAYLSLDRLLFRFYPINEFDTTLEHVNKNKKKITVIWGFVALVIIPLIINYISKLIF